MKISQKLLLVSSICLLTNSFSFAQEVKKETKKEEKPILVEKNINKETSKISDISDTSDKSKAVTKNEQKNSTKKVVIKKKKIVKNEKNKEVSNAYPKSISLETTKEFKEKITKENLLEENLKKSAPIPSVDENDYNNLKNIVRNEIFVSKELSEVPQSYIFENNRNGQLIKLSDINIENSFVMNAYTDFGDIELNISDFTPVGNDNLIFKTKDYKSVAKCNSYAIYIDHKQYGPMSFSVNKSESCWVKDFISSYGTGVNKDAYIDTHLNYTNGLKLLNVSYIKAGWNSSIEEKIYNQRALNVLVDNKLNILISSPAYKNLLHYVKGNELGSKTYNEKSPYLFAANLEENIDYKSFFIFKENNEVKKITSYIKPEILIDFDEKALSIIEQE